MQLVKSRIVTEVKIPQNYKKSVPLSLLKQMLGLLKPTLLTSNGKLGATV